MATTRGKLLISTRSQAGGRKIVKLVSCAIMYIFAIFFIINFEVFQKMGKDILHNASFGTVIGLCLLIFFFVWPTIGLVVTFANSKSFCEVYENAVVGRTGLSTCHPKDPMRDFEISYNEIVNVTASGNMLYIQAKYESYDVLALKNREEALKEIKSRMTGNG